MGCVVGNSSWTVTKSTILEASRLEVPIVLLFSLIYPSLILLLLISFLVTLRSA